MFIDVINQKKKKNYLFIVKLLLKFSDVLIGADEVESCKNLIKNGNDIICT